MPSGNVRRIRYVAEDYTMVVLEVPDPPMGTDVAEPSTIEFLRNGTTPWTFKWAGRE